jgi:Cd2+/Zn2+-exporting ATPase
MSHSHAESGNTHRHHHGDGHAHAHDARHIDPPAQVKEAACADDGCGACAMPATLLQPDPSARGRSFRIATMDCAAEEAEIRRTLDGMPGIRGLRFQLGQRVLTIDADESSIAPALAAVRKSGFDPQPIAGGESEAGHAVGDGHDHEVVRGQVPKLAGALLLAIGAEIIGYFAPETMVWRGAGLAVAAIAIWLAGFDVYKKGLTALRHGRLNINALMTVAVTGAFAIGQWPEAAMVMALYAIAEAIEARAVDRARNAIKGLLAMAPEQASVRQADGSWATLPVGQGRGWRSAAGEAGRARSDGRRRPLGADQHQSGAGHRREHPRRQGERGSGLCRHHQRVGHIRVRGHRPGLEFDLGAHHPRRRGGAGDPGADAGLRRQVCGDLHPGGLRDRVAVALLGPWLLGWTWLQGVYKALVLLVIACPCALVISTPVTIVSGLAAAARRGILIKGGIYLEEARKLKAIALDKTGTITEGKPKLVDWEVLVRGPMLPNAEHIAAVLAGHSDHPVSRAIAAGLRPNSVEAKDFKAIAGRGVQADIGGTAYVLGNHRLIEERGQCSPALEASLRTHEEAGRTVSLLASDAGPVALFAVADTIKPSSRDAVASLKALGITPVMLTGDNQATATAIAHEAGIAEARGNLLPEDKLEAIKALQAEHGLTAMTGDGINDAPALAQADIGVAMGAAGTDTAMEAADVVVMNDDLRRIAETVRLSRSTHAVLWQNITLALGIKAVFLVTALEARPWPKPPGSAALERAHVLDVDGWQCSPTWAPAWAIWCRCGSTADGSRPISSG